MIGTKSRNQEIDSSDQVAITRPCISRRRTAASEKEQTGAQDGASLEDPRFGCQVLRHFGSHLPIVILGRVRLSTSESYPQRNLRGSLVGFT